MDCPRIKEMLSGYLDGALGPADNKVVEEHLASCEQCSAQLEDLGKTIARLRGLDDVDPPAWLTQKVMARIRDGQPRRSLFQRIFFPIHVKVPLQAAATVLIAVVTIYIFRTMQQDAPKMRTEQQGPVVSKEKAEAPPAPGRRMPLEKEQAPVLPSPAPQDKERSRSDAARDTETSQHPPAEDAQPLKEERPAAPPVQRDSQREKALPGAVGQTKQPSAAGPARLEERILRDSAPGRIPLKKAAQVLWEDEAITPGDIAGVTRVVLVQEKGNELVLDVTYFLSDTFDGVATVGVFPDIPDWSVAEAGAVKGKHTVTVSVSRMPSATLPGDSTSLRIEIAGYRDNSFIGPLYRRVVPFAKHWEGR